MSQRNKHKKFKPLWSNQTDLGKAFGISAVAVGKLLVGAGLRDGTTKKATDEALAAGYAKATPLKDGTPFFMWNVERVRAIIAADHKPLSPVEFWVREVRETIKYAEKMDDDGHDKMASIMYDFMFDDVPRNIRSEVRKIIEAELERLYDDEKPA